MESSTTYTANMNEEHIVISQPPQQLDEDVQITDIEKCQLANLFFSDLLKNYIKFNDNRHILGRVYSCCDKCYKIRPKWTPGRVDHYNKYHDYTVCSDCHSQLSDEDKTFFEDVEYHPLPNAGLYA